MTQKVISGGTLARVDRLVRFLNAATKSLTTDLESIDKIARVGLGFQDIGLGNIKFITVPWEYETRRSTAAGVGGPTRRTSCGAGSKDDQPTRPRQRGDQGGRRSRPTSRRRTRPAPVRRARASHPAQWIRLGRPDERDAERSPRGGGPCA